MKKLKYIIPLITVYLIACNKNADSGKAGHKKDSATLAMEHLDSVSFQMRLERVGSDKPKFDCIIVESLPGWNDFVVPDSFLVVPKQ